MGAGSRRFKSCRPEFRNEAAALRSSGYRTRYLAIVDQVVNRAVVTINNLLEMSRPKHPRNREVDLEAMIRDDTVGVSIPKNVRSWITMDPNPFIVWGDPEPLR